jgi:two-component system nitrate/nitrite response regulator NarL
MGVSVVIVEDHDLVAAALSQLLRAEGVNVCAVTGTLSAAATAIVRHHPDVVVADYLLPDGTGTELVGLLDSKHNPAVLIVTAEPTEPIAHEALVTGCAGVLAKTASTAELVAAIRIVASGGTCFPRTAVTRAVSRTPAPEQLSEREREVLQLIAEGQTTETIARTLMLSQHTVRNHLRNAQTRLGVHTKLDAVLAAANLGEIRLPHRSTPRPESTA